MGFPVLKWKKVELLSESTQLENSNKFMKLSPADETVKQ